MPLTGSDLRRIALGLPGTEEKAHFGKADFRVRNKIFASLPDEETAVVKLTPEQQQQLMAEAEPAIFAPVPGGWGRKGWTRVRLPVCDAATLESALRTAWGLVGKPVSRRPKTNR